MKDVKIVKVKRSSHLPPIRCSEEELSKIKESAEVSGMDLSEYVRVRCLMPAINPDQQDRTKLSICLNIVSGITTHTTISDNSLKWLGYHPEVRFEATFNDAFLKHKAIDVIMNFFFPGNISGKFKYRKNEKSKVDIG
jgi:hypothetical protein